MVTYIMGVDAMMSYFNVAISLAVGLGLMVFMGIQVRSALGGFMSIGEGFKSIMVIYALGAFLYLLFNHMLGTVIDPELPGKIGEATIEKTMSMMENFDMPEDQLEQIYDDLDEDIKKSVYDNYTMTGFIKTYLMTLLFGSIGAIIGAAITKKEDPNPFTVNNEG
jgi:hypothetical protein